MHPTIHHVSLGTNQFEKASAFYDSVLNTLGLKRIVEYPGGIGYGRTFPEFWLQYPIDGKLATVGNGSHIGFFANSKRDVDAFYQAAIDAGANDDGKPGTRRDYGEPYYGCFIRDLDGHKIEAVYWDLELAQQLGL